VALADDLERIVTAAAASIHDEARVAAVLAAEPAPGARSYLCAFETAAGERSWLVLDDEGVSVSRRRAVRDTVAITALCEVAAESAGGGDLDELRSQLVALRLTERPPGIDEAEEAVLALQSALGSPPHVASPTRLDSIGAAARRLERALDPTVASPFAAAMQAAQVAIEALGREVEASYRLPLEG
jgi:hypothetical protein